jgi:hypothetical protein
LEIPVRLAQLGIQVSQELPAQQELVKLVRLVQLEIPEQQVQLVIPV